MNEFERREDSLEISGNGRNWTKWKDRPMLRLKYRNISKLKRTEHSVAKYFYKLYNIENNGSYFRRKLK